MTTPTPPGAGTFPSFEPTPPEMGTPTPAEQNQIDLQNTIDKSNAKELFCDSLDQSAPLELSTECDCYRTSIEFIQSDLQMWAEYNRKNEAYDNYIDDKKAWDQAKLAQRDKYSKVKTLHTTGTCGTQPNCNQKTSKGDWENTGAREMHGVLRGRSECR